MFSANAAHPHGVTDAAICTAGTNMCLMAEILGVSFCPFRPAYRTSGLMTRSARTDIPPAAVGSRPVALETACVPVRSRRHRKGNAPPRRSVTCRTIGLLRVLAVIEHDVETAKSRKRFHRRGCMTDRADRVLVIRKLRRVTARARHVARHLRGRQANFAFVAEQARQPGVHRVRMREF